MEVEAPTPAEQESTLSQTEIEKMMAQVAEREQSAGLPAEGSGGGKTGGKPLEGARAYDFRQPAFLSPGEVRKLRIWHEDFARALAARLSMYLRLEVDLKLGKLQAMPHHQLVESFSEPAYLTLFKIEPLRGIALLDVPPKLGLGLVERLLGGGMAGAAGGRELSEIEASLLDELIQVILGEWAGHWAQRQDLRAVILGHETSGRYVQAAARDTMMLLVEMEMQLGEGKETLRFGFPCHTLEPLAKGLGQMRESKGSEAAPGAALRWNPALDDVEVPVSAEWNGMEVRVRDLARLKPGDVIELRPDAASNVQLRLGEALKFAGRIGTINGAWAVEITQRGKG